MELQFASFFSGIGGFELGLERAGHRCVFACEIDPFARAVYEARFGRVPAGDLTRVRPDEIPDADLWCGGFPCQDLSTAGKRAGLGEGTRSGLVWTFLELARARQPKWILLENVPGLLSGRTDRNLESEDEPLGEPAADASWFGALLGALDDLGYVGAWRVLDARFFGVPQRRRRVFILAGRAGSGADPAAILLEPEGVRGRPAPRRASREGVAHTVTSRLAKGVSQRDDDDDDLIPVAGTVRSHTRPGSNPNGSSLIAATVQAHGRSVRDDFNMVIANGVTASAGHHGRSSPRGDGSDNLIAATLTSGGHPNRNAPGRRAEDDVNLVPVAFDMAQITSAQNRSRCEPGDPAPSLHATPPPPHVAFLVRTSHAGGNGSNVSRDESPTLGLDQPPAVAFDWTKNSHGHGAHADSASALGAHHTKHDALSLSSGVRRLTPRECERLQGFPDDWTLVPFNGQSASDSRRYKAVGNAVAVPVLEWIGRRLAAGTTRPRSPT